MLAVGAVLADWDPAGIPRAHAAPSITNPRIAREPAPIPSDPFRNHPSDFARGPPPRHARCPTCAQHAWIRGVARGGGWRERRREPT